MKNKILMEGSNNDTEMVRPFGKRVNDWRHLPSTTLFLTAYIVSRKSGNVDNLIVTQKGGFGGGGITWMHEDVTCDFSQVFTSDQLWI